MNNIYLSLFTLPLGFALGIFYFSSLWLTVRKLPTIKWPIRLFIGSYLGRMGITVVGFYLIMAGHWERPLIGLVGFMVARSILVNHWGLQQPLWQQSKQK